MNFEPEIILVDDGSSDRSWQIIQEICGSDKRAIGIRLIRNYGEHYAITAGLDVATGDIVGAMACDGQDNIEELSKLIARLQDGYDIVLAQRVDRKDSLLKKLASGTFYALYNFLDDRPLYPNTGNYIFMTNRACQYLRLHREGFRAFFALVAQLGLKTAVVPVSHMARTSGKGRYTFRKSFRLARDTIYGYSRIPIRLLNILGLVFSGIAVVAGVVIALKKILFGVPVAGWASLMAAILFIGGFLFLGLSILAYYVERTLHEVVRRPLYFVEAIEGRIEKSKLIQASRMVEARSNLYQISEGGILGD